MQTRSTANLNKVQSFISTTGAVIKRGEETKLNQTDIRFALVLILNMF